MFRKMVLGGFIVLAFVAAPSAQAGRMELTTYYPAPHGEYSSLNASQSFMPPRVATANRLDATTTPRALAGMVIFNTTTNQLEVYDGAAWVSAGIGGGGPRIWAAATTELIDTNSFEDLASVTTPATFPGGWLFVTFDGDYNVSDCPVGASDVTFRILHGAVERARFTITGDVITNLWGAIRRVNLFASFQAGAGANTITVQGMKSAALWGNGEPQERPRLTVYS